MVFDNFVSGDVNKGIKRLTSINFDEYSGAFESARRIEMGNAPTDEIGYDMVAVLKEIENKPKQDFGTLFRGLGPQGKRPFSTPTEERLTSGQILKISHLEKLDAGSVFKMPLSSFSADISVAKVHFQPQNWKSKYLLRLSGPVSAVDTRGISALSEKEQELLTKGTFRVTKVIRGKTGTVLDIIQESPKGF